LQPQRVSPKLGCAQVSVTPIGNIFKRLRMIALGRNWLLGANGFWGVAEQNSGWGAGICAAAQELAPNSFSFDGFCSAGTNRQEMQ
jgi:hypothetical protein